MSAHTFEVAGPVESRVARVIIDPPDGEAADLTIEILVEALDRLRHAGAPAEARVEIEDRLVSTCVTARWVPE